VVIAGLLNDKPVEAFVTALASPAAAWIICPTGGARGTDAEQVASRVAPLVTGSVVAVRGIDEALQRARERAPEGGLIVVCGSFTVVGPALRQLGLY
jgi:folylpolyglutamate synthase/dihydropteroate synthase